MMRPNINQWLTPLRLIIVSIALALCGPSLASAQIRHLELGAANYEASAGNSSKRFFVLEQTVTALIAQYGPTGEIYLNDISESGLAMASAHLKNWLAQQGYSQIEVFALPGDYGLIPMPFVKTAQLANPGRPQLPDRYYPRSSKHRVRTLENIAALSETGLKITSYFVHGLEDFALQIRHYLNPSSSFTKLDEIPPAYYFSDGQSAEQALLPGRSEAFTFVLSTQLKYTRPKVTLEKLRTCADVVAAVYVDLRPLF